MPIQICKCVDQQSNSNTTFQFGNLETRVEDSPVPDCCHWLNASCHETIGNIVNKSSDLPMDPQNISNLLLMYAALSHNYSRLTPVYLILALSPSANQAPCQALGKYGPFPALSVWTSCGMTERPGRNSNSQIHGSWRAHKWPNGIEYLSVHCNILQWTPVPLYHQYRNPN